MNSEGLASVPREHWPSSDELEGYTESQYPPDPDYSAYRRELSLWLHDYRREQDSKRQDQQGKAPLLGHEPEDVVEQRNGYDKDEFLKNVARKIKSRPLH